MRRSIIVAMVFAYSVMLFSCNDFLDHQPLGEDFGKNFVSDQDQNFPLNGQPQVYLGGLLGPDQLSGLSVVLTDSAANPVAGTVVIEAPDLTVSFIPDTPLKPSTAYVLTITTTAGRVFTFHFSTRAGGSIGPVVDITGIEAGDSLALSGSTVRGLVRVTATVSDDGGIITEVTSLLAGTTQGVLTAPPYVFYVNTAFSAPGPQEIEIRAFDGDGNMGSAVIGIMVDGSPAPAPAWIFDGATDYDLSPSPELEAGMTAMSFLSLYALRDTTYLDMFNTNYLLGTFDISSHYQRAPGFNSSGVLTLSLASYVFGPFALPGSSFDLILPDTSRLTIWLPALSFTNFNQQGLFYVAADGSTYWALHAAGCTGRIGDGGEVPDSIPLAAFACPPAASPPP